MKKANLAAITSCWMAMGAFAGESTLTKTFQPLDGLGSGEIQIMEVACHDWYAHSGQPTAIGLISARNVPPSNSRQAVDDINLASASQIYFACQDIEAKVPRLVMTAGKFAAARGHPRENILRASLECLRRTLPEKLLRTELTFTSSPENSEWMGRIVAEFNRHDRSKVFYSPSP